MTGKLPMEIERDLSLCKTETEKLVVLNKYFETISAYALSIYGPMVSSRVSSDGNNNLVTLNDSDVLKIGELPVTTPIYPSQYQSKK